jgi:hypothetical protein
MTGIKADARTFHLPLAAWLQFIALQHTNPRNALSMGKLLGHHSKLPCSTASSNRPLA